MDRHPRVLQVLPALQQAGGIEKGLLDWVRVHPQHVRVASAGGRLAGYFEQHFTLPLDTKNPLHMMCNVHRLVRLIRQQHIELVHVRSRAPAWSVYTACEITGTPWLATYHGLYSMQAPFKRYYNSVMTRGRTVIAISRWVAQHVRHHYPNAHITLIHEGIDTEYFQPQVDELVRGQWRARHGIAEGHTLVLLPGRISRWKGQHVLLQAMEGLGDRWVVVLLGGCQSAQYMHSLQQKAATLPVKVLFMPATDDMRAAYMASDVVVSCSTEPEAFGRITAEALAMERPYIGTYHGGTVELTCHGRFGQLIPPDCPKSLCEALHQLRSSSGAHRYVRQHYDAHHMYTQTMDLYKRLCCA